MRRDDVVRMTHRMIVRTCGQGVTIGRTPNWKRARGGETGVPRADKRGAAPAGNGATREKRMTVGVSRRVPGCHDLSVGRGTGNPDVDVMSAKNYAERTVL